MYFKDVFTEIKAELMKLLKVKTNPLLCPSCKKGTLVKQTEVEHMIDVAVRKFICSFTAGAISAGAGSPVGGSVPAPDYWFRCPNCKKIFILVETLRGDEFVPIDIFERIFSFGNSTGGQSSRRRQSSSSRRQAPQQQNEEIEEA